MPVLLSHPRRRSPPYEVGAVEVELATGTVRSVFTHGDGWGGELWDARRHLVVIPVVGTDSVFGYRPTAGDAWERVLLPAKQLPTLLVVPRDDLRGSPTQERLRSWHVGEVTIACRDP
jgi:hypothetical protein